MKKLPIIIAVFAMMATTGCLKDTPNTDFSKVGATAEILYSGMEYFGASSPQGQSYALNFNQDTLTYDVIVNLNSPYTLKTDTKVTIGVNDGARTAYNATSAVQYSAMPAGVYSFPVTTGTIKAGTRQLHFSLQFYKSQFDALTDPTVSYMVPISLTDASGVLIASNFSTIYPHSIGNPIAGAYTWDFSRWNAGDSTSVGLNGTSFKGHPTVFSPDDPNTIEVQSNYYNSPHYVLSFTGSGSSLSNFAIQFRPDDLKYMNDNGITVTGGPFIITADPVNKVYEFYYTVFNGSANRFLKDKYYK